MTEYQRLQVRLHPDVVVWSSLAKTDNHGFLAPCKSIEMEVPLQINRDGSFTSIQTFHTHTRARAHAHAHAHIDTHTHKHKHPRTHARTHAGTHTYTHTKFCISITYRKDALHPWTTNEQTTKRKTQSPEAQSIPETARAPHYFSSTLLSSGSHPLIPFVSLLSTPTVIDTIDGSTAKNCAFAYICEDWLSK